MKSMSVSKGKLAHESASSGDDISNYSATLSPAYAGICQKLRDEIDAALPHATSKIWHGSPVWFVGENPVTGYHTTAKKGVNLLFWSGQMFDEPMLKATGKFQAAQIQFNDAEEIDLKSLRGWLNKASSIIWDYKNLCRPK
jgi:hypothetical protein